MLRVLTALFGLMAGLAAWTTGGGPLARLAQLPQFEGVEDGKLGT
jgi:hypothetical protein